MYLRQLLSGGLAALCACAVCCATAGAASAAAPAPLRLGFQSDNVLVSGTTATRAPWIARAVSDGAGIVRVNVDWSLIAPRKLPPLFDGKNPNSRGYQWQSLDSVVRDITAGGLSVCLTLYKAPTWAEGPNRPGNAKAGSWRPNAADYGQFASAAARRYDGHFPDPRHSGATLPRVSCYQAWNEPNITYYLSPQFVPSGQGFTEVGAEMYRSLLNSAYHAIKAVSPTNFVLMGGTAPFVQDIRRTPPVAFYRDLFCLRGPALTPIGGCPQAFLDGIDNHPQAPNGPTWQARNPDEVAVPDIHKVTRVLDAAVLDGHVLPRVRKAVWVSELEWSSNPPLARGVSLPLQARWYEMAFYELWRQGVSTIMLLELADPGTFPDHPDVFQSGLYFHYGTPKPAATAFKFPFLVTPIHGAVGASAARTGKGRWGRRCHHHGHHKHHSTRGRRCHHHGHHKHHGKKGRQHQRRGSHHKSHHTTHKTHHRPRIQLNHFEVWGRSPQAGELRIEIQQGTQWNVVRILPVAQWQVFSTTVSAPPGPTNWRAEIGSQTSLTWAPGLVRGQR